jgi:FlaA1/EpsC-like NDP-sugar epimerase
MARTLIRLSGKSEDSVQIQFTGLREGEKLEEELFYRHEKVLATTYDKIKRINGSKPDWTSLCRQLEELRASLSIDGAGPVRAKLREIVPEYVCQSDDPARSDEIGAGRSHRHAAGSI